MSTGGRKSILPNSGEVTLGQVADAIATAPDALYVPDNAQGHILLHEAGGSFAWEVFSGLFNHLYKEAKLPEVPLVLPGVGSRKTDAAT